MKVSTSVKALTLLACVGSRKAQAQQQATPPEASALSTTVAMIINPTDEIVHLYQIYGVANTTAGGGTAQCVNLGDVQAKDSSRVTIAAGARAPLVFYFQADSSNGGVVGVSLSMRAQVPDTLRWTVAPRLNTQLRSQQMASRGLFSSTREQQNQTASRNPHRC